MKMSSASKNNWISKWRMTMSVSLYPQLAPQLAGVGSYRGLKNPGTQQAVCLLLPSRHIFSGYIAFILWNPTVFQRKAKELYWLYLKHSGNSCIMTRFTHYIFPPHEMRASLPVGASFMRNECFSLLPVRNLKTWCKNHSGITTYSPAGALIS